MSDRESTRQLAEWFREWRQPLRQFLVGRSGVPLGDLDDVAQEVFLRLLRYDRTDGIEHPRAYLYKMAANIAAQWSIRMHYARPHEPRWLAELTEEITGETAEQELEDALMALTPRQREVVRLQYFESLSRAQIAERLDLSERSVKRILVKCYERLRQCLNVE